MTTNHIALLEESSALLQAAAIPLFVKHVDPKRPLRHHDDAAGAVLHAQYVLAANALDNWADELRAEARRPAPQPLTELPQTAAALTHPDGCCLAPFATTPA